MDGKEIKIMLLGKTGSGKSSLGNTILGEEIFKADNSPNSVTTECTSHSIKRNGKTIRVFDTPGVFDTDTNSSDLNEKFYNCVKDCDPGPHAFLLVLKVERYTKQEEEAVKETLKYFSAEALKYTTVVFTHGDQLDEGQKIEDWVYENEALRSLLQECGGRCHVFDNKYWKNSQDSYRNNQVQVTELLRTIEETVREKNGGRCYTTGFWQYLKHMKIKGVPLKYLLAALLGGTVAGVGAAAVAALLFEAGTASTVVTGLGVGAGVLCALSPDEVGEVASGAARAVREGASGAARAVGEGASGAARAVGEGASGAARAVGEAASDAVNKAAKLASAAVENVPSCMSTKNKSKTY